jgi:hypothetical protein
MYPTDVFPQKASVPPQSAAVVQVPPHICMPVQTPNWHDCWAEQTLPHAPQLLLSLDVSTHAP